MNQSSTEAIFDELVKDLGLICEVEDCENDARWMIDMHGCAQDMICAAHLEMWLNLVKTKFSQYGTATCKFCYTRFSHASQLFNVTRV